MLVLQNTFTHKQYMDTKPCIAAGVLLWALCVQQMHFAPYLYIHLFITENLGKKEKGTSVVLLFF